VKYRKGKEMYISDTLSRAFISHSSSNLETDSFPDESIYMISVSQPRYLEIQMATQSELATLHDVIISGWPDTRIETPMAIRQYWDSRDNYRFPTE